MAGPNLSITTNQFLGSSSIFSSNVLSWDIRNQGVQVRTNVKTPQALAKISGVTGPRPYSTGDNFGNGVTVSDRILTAYQSKWDFDLDTENLRNTYLAELPDQTFEQYFHDQVTKEYLDYMLRLTLYSGVRNAGGAGAADICDGWGTIIAALITGLTLTPVATGAITSANAVTKVEQLADAVPLWMQERGHFIYCSYDVFKKYTAHYRTLNGFVFQPNATRQYALDNRNAYLRPVAWMGTSQRLIATIDNNFVFGTDIETTQLYVTPYLNYFKCRAMMVGGCQIQDLAALVVNDQA